MLLIQLTGLPSAGKTTIANLAKEILIKKNWPAEVIDGDEFRKDLCRDLSFSKADRMENIRRLGIVANMLVKNKIITFIAAINPYEEMRVDLKKYGSFVKVVWISCNLETLIKRDTKGLYKRALLPENHPLKLTNLSGINDIYETPLKPDLIIDTSYSSIEESVDVLIKFIIQEKAKSEEAGIRC